MKISELVGKRLLLKFGTAPAFSRTAEIQEYRVLEVSPSGNWVKLMGLHGNKFWKPCVDVAIVEELKPLVPEARPADPDAR